MKYQSTYKCAGSEDQEQNEIRETKREIDLARSLSLSQAPCGEM